MGGLGAGRLNRDWRWPCPRCAAGPRPWYAPPGAPSAPARLPGRWRRSEAWHRARRHFQFEHVGGQGRAAPRVVARQLAGIDDPELTARISHRHRLPAGQALQVRLLGRRPLGDERALRVLGDVTLGERSGVAHWRRRCGRRVRQQRAAAGEQKQRRDQRQRPEPNAWHAQKTLSQATGPRQGRSRRAWLRGRTAAARVRAAGRIASRRRARRRRVRMGVARRVEAIIQLRESSTFPISARYTRGRRRHVSAALREAGH